MTGIVFDIKEFSLHDGPGARITVFMKGCPLRCLWCHNPEGLSKDPQLLYKEHLCQRCGLCTAPPRTPLIEAFGRDPSRCPEGLLSISGTEMTPTQLCEKLLPFRSMLEQMEGGVTFSGGEPMLHWDFVIKSALLLKEQGFHVAIQTCGHAPSHVFTSVCSQMDLIMMDLKLMDEKEHQKYTGVSNALILENAKWLKNSGIPHRFRTPLIPRITDTAANLDAIRQFVGNSPWETLNYNPLAGAKYPLLGMNYPLEKGIKL